MDLCIPETPLTQCHFCMRRRAAGQFSEDRRTVVIDASTVLVKGRCQFRVDRATLGQAALEVGAEPASRAIVWA
jgi:hypothetical protein